jgi:hypothetical protein
MTCCIWVRCACLSSGFVSMGWTQVPIQAAKNRGGVDLDLDLHPQLLPNRVLPSVARELKLGTLGGLAARKQSNKE